MKKKMVFLTIVLFCVCGCAPTNGNSANIYLEPTKEHSFDSSLAYDFKVDSEVQSIRFFFCQDVGKWLIR